ncbi:MAG: Stealth CR1 domain-containing protein [Bryobacteraceae bacterium]
MGEQIDAVYTWVDGSDPEFQDSFRSYASAQPDAPGLSRFRNNDELRYSLRSVFRFAPWIRRIHILTNGQVPSWLDSSHEKIHLVTHAEVFPDPECLPTFNSNAIEMCLHRIPGLSRRFIYFNDDVFLGRNVQPSDFFLKGGGQKVFVQNTRLPSDPDHGSSRDRACAYTQNVLTQLWGPPSVPRRLPAHTPQAYDRDILLHLESMLQSEFQKTASHRFRSRDDLVLSVLYGYSLSEAIEERSRHELLSLMGLSRDYSFLMLDDNFAWAMRVYLDILLKQPRFFCINDDMTGVPPHHPLLLSLRTFLRLYFPWRAAAERG